MLTYKIHLFRHGITRANLEGRYVGLSDYPLCQEGIDALKEYVKDKDYPPVEKIYTSPLRRCRETAHILYPGYKTFDVPQLMEMDFGTYEGKTLDELQNDESFIAWSRDSMHNAPPEGEDGVAFIRRRLSGHDGKRAAQRRAGHPRRDDYVDAGADGLPPPPDGGMGVRCRRGLHHRDDPGAVDPGQGVRGAQPHPDEPGGLGGPLEHQEIL